MNDKIRNVQKPDIQNVEQPWFKESCPMCRATWESKDGWTTVCPNCNKIIVGNQ